MGRGNVMGTDLNVHKAKGFALRSANPFAPNLKLGQICTIPTKCFTYVRYGLLRVFLYKNVVQRFENLAMWAHQKKLCKPVHWEKVFPIYSFLEFSHFLSNESIYSNSIRIARDNEKSRSLLKDSFSASVPNTNYQS